MSGTDKTSTTAQPEPRSVRYQGDKFLHHSSERFGRTAIMGRRVHRLRDAFRIFGGEVSRRSAASKSVHLADGLETKKVSFLRNKAHKLRDLSRRVRSRYKTKKTSAALSRLSDGEYILFITELLSPGGGANPIELEALKQVLREDRSRRSDLVDRFLGERYDLSIGENRDEHDPQSAQIMGTRAFLTKEMWVERASKIGVTASPKTTGAEKLAGRRFDHSGEYVVSAIASLYKGRRFTEAFLENIVAQTMFDRSELIIIDANSPEGEEEIITQYQKIYPNIVYKRVNHRIGIYDAWNDAVEMARGRYLTNTNFDDLRRSDSFELQSSTLDSLNFVDVAYQDFFYSFDSDLDFEDVVKFGYKSALPIVTANNLLRFNSPHNAPMWRADLHKQLGFFDTSFKSAGDHEFWLRCMLNGKRFYKINSPHIVYFQNPEGISTNPQSTGAVEGRRLMNMYARRLASSHLKKSRAEFAAELGIEPAWSWGTSLYDVVQNELERIENRLQ